MHSPVALLQTCRQVHSEAALIPFATVNYIIESSAFETFIRSMLTVQKAALKQLTLVMGVGGFSSHVQFRPSILYTLTGVQHLTLIIGDSMMNNHPLHRLEKLARLPLRTVNILLDLASHSRALFREIIPLEELQEAADVLKSKLLRGSESYWIREGAVAASGMADGKVSAGRSAGRLRRGVDKEI